MQVGDTRVARVGYRIASKFTRKETAFRRVGKYDGGTKGCIGSDVRIIIYCFVNEQEMSWPRPAAPWRGAMPRRSFPEATADPCYPYTAVSPSPFTCDVALLLFATLIFFHVKTHYDGENFSLKRNYGEVVGNF